MPVKVANEKNCSGCYLCALACSFFTAGEHSFNPAEAMIKISRKNGSNTFSVVLRDDCIECGKCVDYCFYDVLTFEH